LVVRVPEEEADVGDGKENVDEIEAFIEAAANGRQRENAQAKEDGEGRGTAVLFTDGILAFSYLSRLGNFRLTSLLPRMELA
jgi:hypothetical protein